MFSARFTIFLLFILLIPFVLRILGEEPYPAVLLPSYASTIKNNDSLILQTTWLYGIKQDGNWGKLDNRIFFDPIPLEHVSDLLANHLCLQEDAAKQSTKKYKFYHELGLLRPMKLSANDSMEIKTWIKNKLTAQGFSTEKIKMSGVRETISISTGRVTSTELTSENIYTLDQ